MDNDFIAKHYDETLPYYKHLWGRGANAVHYGFWDEETKTIEEALLNENKFLTEAADIKPSDKVLDAGCGIGGSSVWIAKNVGANVIGITLSTKQLEEAKKIASKYGVSDKTEFEIGDYLNTRFADNTFDIVWAIESVCYAENKADFLKESYRILKPGGRLVLADGFLDREAVGLEKKLLKDLLMGFALTNLANISDFKKDMDLAGFREIKHWNKSTNVKKSLRILYIRVRIAYPLLKIAHLFGLIPDTVIKYGPVGIAQYKLLNTGLMKYAVFLGKK